MALVTGRDVTETFGEGLRMSPALVSADPAFTRLDAVVVATYVGPIGIRYEWRAAGMPDRDQFFHYPEPVINASRPRRMFCSPGQRSPKLS